jgi:hypothetical protein
VFSNKSICERQRHPSASWNLNPTEGRLNRRGEEWSGYLVQHNVGVDDEDDGGVGAKLAVGGGGVAGGAGGGAAVDVVAEVVLPDDLRRGDGRG